MQLSNCSPTNNEQWQIYKQLELIPEFAQSSYSNSRSFRFGLDLAWRSLISLLVDELVDHEQQVEYLERCWAANEVDLEVPSPTRTLQRLWVLMN
jgi:hypothetical protein